jgi:hypothetical protein
LSQRNVCFQHARVALKILPWAELERIDEHAHQNGAVGSGALNQCTMAWMEPTHGGHELEITGLPLKPGGEIRP